MTDRKTCLLTGASGGIGSAIAQELANKGMQLILVGRQQNTLAELVKSLPISSKGEHQIIVADITTEQGLKTLQKNISSIKIDLLINNAGISDFTSFEQQTEESIINAINTNLLAPMRLIHRILSKLKQQDKATIVNIGSTFGSIGYPFYASYCASKFGLRGFTESLKRELVDDNIRVLYFAPRATATNINSENAIKMNKSLGNKIDTPEVVAKSFINFLDSSRSRFFVGWPEKLFVKINGAFPSIVDSAIKQKMAKIRQFITPSV